jgi:phage gp16-like protein
VWLYFIPLYIAGAILLFVGVLALLSRFRGGKYARPVMRGVAKIPGVRGLMMRASRAALAKQNPEAASALEKLERAGVAKNPERAQAALSRLTAAERRAYLEVAGQEGALPEPANRQQRRAMQKLQKQQQQRRGR